MRLRAEQATLSVPLDAFVAVLHRPSGATHLLTEPAPQILAALGDEALTLDALLARLATGFDLGSRAREALSARVTELVDTGLIVPE
jgi:PqqD family protein of HPr-rel-A system